MADLVASAAALNRCGISGFKLCQDLCFPYLVYCYMSVLLVVLCTCYASWTGPRPTCIHDCIGYHCALIPRLETVYFKKLRSYISISFRSQEGYIQVANSYILLRNEPPAQRIIIGIEETRQEREEELLIEELPGGEVDGVTRSILLPTSAPQL